MKKSTQHINNNVPTVVVLAHGLDAVMVHVFLALRRTGNFRVVVAGPAGTADKLGGTGDNAGLDEAVMPQIKSKTDIGAMRSLHRIIKKYNARAIFAPSTSGLSVALRARWFTGARVIGYRGTQARVHALDPTYYIALLHPGVNAMVCETTDIRDYLSRYIPARKLSAMPKPFMEDWVADAVAHPMRIPCPADALRLSYVGVSAGRPHKGLQFLVEAISILNSSPKAPRVHLTVVGQADKTLMDNAPDNVHFTGNRPDAVNWIAGSNIFILPSTRDASPRVIREAQACGVPCIVSDIPGARDLIIPTGDLRSGILVPPANPQALANAITQLAASPEEMSLMARNARINIRNNYNMDAYVDFMASVINQAIN